jgi:peptide/nickel transport system ATP-binding protein
MEPILQVADLKKTFFLHGKPQFTAIEDVSFQLYPGEILGVVGESGSGKSTRAKRICRLMDPTEGTITLSGEDVTHAKGERLRKMYEKVQMVFQDPVTSFDPRRTLGDGVGESLKNQGVPAKERSRRVGALLVQCGLDTQFAARYPHQVSGGQCQRAAIARALANEPKVLILDEATSALDVTIQKQILELLGKLQKERGLSYLLICHNLALVQQLCHRVVVLYEGTIVESGTPDEVILSPKNQYTRRLVDAVLG